MQPGPAGALGGSVRFDVIQGEMFSGPGCPQPFTTGEDGEGGGGWVVFTYCTDMTDGAGEVED